METKYVSKYGSIEIYEIDMLICEHMKAPNVIQFFIQTAEEGGYIAQAVGFSIYTEGDTLDETVRNIKEATNCHFGKDESKHCFFS